MYAVVIAFIFLFSFYFGVIDWCLWFFFTPHISSKDTHKTWEIKEFRAKLFANTSDVFHHDERWTGKNVWFWKRKKNHPMLYNKMRKNEIRHNSERRRDILPRSRKTERITGVRLVTLGKHSSKKKPLFVVVVSPSEHRERDERQ